MKRENEDNNYQDQQDQQHQEQFDQMDQQQGTDNDDSQDGTNDTNNFNNQNNQNQDNGGGPNPPKRQRRNDDEEVRLLIPSKVSVISLSFYKSQLKNFIYLKMAGAVIGKGGHNIQKLRTEVCFFTFEIHFFDILFYHF